MKRALAIKTNLPEKKPSKLSSTVNLQTPQASSLTPTSLIRSNRLKHSTKFTNKLIFPKKLDRANTVFVANLDQNISFDEKALTPRVKMDDLPFCARFFGIQIIERPKTDALLRKNKIRNSNLVNKLLKGKFKNRKDARELMLLSLTKNSNIGLSNITLFSDDHKIEVSL